MENKEMELKIAHQQMREAAKALGKAYGRVGGLASAAKLDSKERSERAKKASAARWAKKEKLNEGNGPQ